MASIRDVARAAGVSTTTVSRYLNQGKYLRAEPRERIARAIAELGYTPNHLARSLIRRKTNVIGVIVSDISSSFFSTILLSIEKTANQAGYNLLLANIMNDLDKEYRYLSVFREMRVDGILLTHERMDDKIRDLVRTVDIPIVCPSVRPPDIDRPSVTIDDRSAAFDAVSYLLGLGHRRIALLGAELEEPSSGAARYQGYAAALGAVGLSIDPAYVRLGTLGLASGYRFMGELLALPQRPTAVFAGSDEMAVGALNCLLDSGLSVPRDCSLVGFDDNLIATSVRPQLTTVHQPIAEIGRLSVEALLGLVRTPKASVADTIVGYHLVERSTCQRLVSQGIGNTNGDRD